MTKGGDFMVGSSSKLLVILTMESSPEVSMGKISRAFLVVFFRGKSDPWILQKVGRLEIDLFFVDQLGSLFSIEGAP